MTMNGNNENIYEQLVDLLEQLKCSKHDTARDVDSKITMAALTGTHIGVMRRADHLLTASEKFAWHSDLTIWDEEQHRMEKAIEAEDYLGVALWAMILHTKHKMQFVIDERSECEAENWDAKI